MHGFPNAFVVSPAQGANLISNVPHNLVESATTIAAVIRHALDHDVDEVEATAEAEQAWVEKLVSGGRRFGGQPDCTPGYYNNEGQPTGERGLRNMAAYPEGPLAFFSYIDEWRRSGEFTGVEMRTRDRA